MDASENTALRSSRISRLPGPATHSGLSELSDAQHNTRSQSAIPAPGGARGLKREIPQPAVVPDPKRKPLAARAVEYPSKTPVTRSAVKGQTLASISQIKPPSRQGKPAAASSLNSFTKSFGPGRNAPPERPASKLASRITRSKTPAPPRPKTAHGHRNEEIYEQPPAANGTMTTQPMPPLKAPAHQRSLKTAASMGNIRSRRESSLCATLSKLQLGDCNPSSRVTSETFISHPALSNITIHRPSKDKILPESTAEP